MLTTRDYSLWDNAEYIVNAQVSNDGRWCAYRIGKRSGTMKTILYNYITAQQQVFEKSINSNHNQEVDNPDFSADCKWFAHLNARGLQLLNLETKGKLHLADVEGYRLNYDGSVLVSWKNTPDGKTLFLTSLSNSSTDTILNVEELSADPKCQYVAIITRGETNITQQVRIIALQKGFPQRKLSGENSTRFAGLVWNNSGGGLAFVKTFFRTAERASYHLCCYRTAEKLFIESPALEASPYDLQVSESAMRVFFSVMNKVAVEGNDSERLSNVRIWSSVNSNMPIEHRDKAVNTLDFIWQPKSKRFLAVNDKTHPYAVVINDGKQALVYNRNEYLPRFKYPAGYIDIYIKDLASGTKKLFLKKIREDNGSLAAYDNYVCYYKEKHWWIYDVQKQYHRCITRTLPVSFENTSSEDPGEKPSWGIDGWTKDKRYVVLYDRFDIWLIDVVSNKPIRITSGRADSVTFRVYHSGLFYRSFLKAPLYFSSRHHDSNEGILITSVNQSTLEEGLWYWNMRTGLKQLVAFPGKVAPVMRPKFNRPFMYVLSDFDKPQTLMVADFNGRTSQLYQTNTFQQQFHWGRSALIHYTSPCGKKLKGALYYPAAYDSTKRYPLIVEVYEKRSSELHKYIVPSESTDQSLHIINPVHYTSQGYFVLFPDISYQINEPGFSAAGCINAAIDKLIVLNNNNIDSNKIGLIGHSFGGYETLFTLTQTQRFRAAVAGAAVTDLTDHYLSISESYGGPNLIRMEQVQFRMQCPLDGDALQRNSPLTHVASIHTPLLLWTGDKDLNVDWKQSMKMQMALWRMSRNSQLLIYRGEEHSLEEKANQQDLGLRISQWFAYYLKNDRLPPWIKPPF